jgi:hypothetical protein
MGINFDQLLDLPSVTVVNYQKIEKILRLKQFNNNQRKSWEINPVFVVSESPSEPN